MEESGNGIFYGKIQDLKAEIREVVSDIVINKGKKIEENKNGNLYSFDVDYRLYFFITIITENYCEETERLKTIEVRDYTKGDDAGQQNEIILITEHGNKTELSDQNFIKQVNIGDLLMICYGR